MHSLCNPKAAPAPHTLPGLQLSLPAKKRRKGALELSSSALGAPETFRSPQSRSWEQHGADEGTASLLNLTQVRVCSLLSSTSVVFELVGLW